MIGLFLGEKDLPNEIIKKIEKKKIKYFIIDLTKNNRFKKNKNSFFINIINFISDKQITILILLLKTYLLKLKI